MANFINCWNQLKAKGYKHANGEEVLDKNDRASIESLIKDHAALGVPHEEAARAAIQTHLDEAHAQLQSVYDQVKPTPVSQPTETTTAQPLPEKVQSGEFGKTGYTAVSDQPHVSTIANRFTEERTASGELGEIAPGQGYSAKEMAAQGLKMSPEEINQHVSDLMNGTGDPIAQGQAVRAEEARLSQRSNDLSRAASEDPSNIEKQTAADNAFKDVTDFHNGPVSRLKTVFHATGVGLQGELPVDLSTFNGLREKFLRDTGKPPTAEQEPQLKEMAEKVSNSVKEDNGAKQNLGQAIDKATARRKLPTYDEVRQSISDRMKVEPCRT